jgi:hypothetical protein
VPTALADPPVAPSEQQPPTGGKPGGPDTPAPAAEQPVTPRCAKCGAPLADGQDWCLQCGAGAPDSLSSRAPTWRSAAVILTALAILVAGAATAAYAALSKHDAKAPAPSTTVAQAPTPAATPPAATTPVTPQPPEPGGTASAKIGAPTTIAPSSGATPPKIPLSAPTPTPAATTPVVTPGTGGSTPTTTTPKSGADNGTSAPGEAHPEALLLDTNAASTYNPYNYAAGNFGDPSLTIDGDRSTGWTALVEPSVAPKMAEGVVIDLNTPRKLSALALSTTTPGMTVQIYGAVGQAPPTSITDPAWAALTPSLVAKKKHARIKFGGTTAAGQAAAKQAYRFVVLWISQAPASAVGTPDAPGHVSLNEVELFARKK